eukprot:COSAG02_NODE_38145_length_432_cov_2.351351_1_plen_47_part_10
MHLGQNAGLASWVLRARREGAPRILDTFKGSARARGRARAGTDGEAR